MSQNTSMTPAQWMTANALTPDQVINGIIAWPFHNIPISAINDISKIYPSSITNPNYYTGTVISILGILLSTLSISTAYRKTFKEKNAFYTSMMIISILDFFFNICHLLVRAYRSIVQTTGSSSYVELMALNYVRGIAFSLSLISDLGVLALSIERHIAVSNPQVYHKMSHGKKKVGRAVAASIVITLGLCRMHYAFIDDVVWTNGKYMYATSTKALSFFQVLRTFSDMILPFVLLTCMIIVSTRLCIIIVKRYKTKKKKALPFVSNVGETSRVHNLPSTVGPADRWAHQPGKEKVNLEEGTTNAIILTLILDFLFMANQTSYCLYTVGALLNNVVLTYDSDYDLMMYYCRVQAFYKPMSLFTVVTECFSHSINFLLYVLLSKGYRNEFRKFIKHLC